MDINACASGPCENGANCVNQLAGGYLCQCAAGYEGVTCGINSNDCSANPCQNGAFCMDLVNDFMCLCNTGYSGKRCETVAATESTPVVVGDVGTGGCKDLDVRCGQYDQSLCSAADHYIWAKINCPLLCGTCGVDINVNMVNTQTGNCQDLDQRCAQYDLSLCTVGEHVAWAQTYCPLKCGTCGGAVTGGTQGYVAGNVGGYNNYGGGNMGGYNNYGGGYGYGGGAGGGSMVFLGGFDD